MTKLEQAARQALEALEDLKHQVDHPNKPSWLDLDEATVAITALREALEHPEQDWPSGGEAEQAEQEPVAWFIRGKKRRVWWECVKGSGIPLYDAPVRTKDLTDDEIAMCMGKDLWNVYKNQVDFARAVIAADRENNK